MGTQSNGNTTFGFNKPITENNEQTIIENPAVEKETEKVKTSNEESTNDSDAEYTDTRSITISLVKNYSLYRRSNDKVLPKRRDYIGGSISASRILSSNKEEVETYFPNIIGLPPNNENFLPRVKQYLNNIRIPVDELGRTFDISFHYYHKKDYYNIKREEDRIEQEYQQSNRQNIQLLRSALEAKITKLNTLEGTKCRIGYPVNVDDYLLYRHCLLYKDIAKDIALINSDANIRFYFKDDQKEQDKLRKYRVEVNKAKSNYVSCLADEALFDAIYVQYCAINNLPVIASLMEDRLSREIKLDKFSSDEPVKFNKIFNNKDIKLISTIEKLIARGELVRLQDNQNILTQDGIFIGANMNEAVAWFKNVENANAVKAFYNKLNNI